MRVIGREPGLTDAVSSIPNSFYYHIDSHYTPWPMHKEQLENKISPVKDILVSARLKKAAISLLCVRKKNYGCVMCAR